MVNIFLKKNFKGKEMRTILLRARKYLKNIICLLPLLTLAFNSFSQTLITGHYQPGFSGGLKSGILPQGEATILLNDWLTYFSNKFVDDSPSTQSDLNGELNIIATRFALVRMTGETIFGANYGFNVSLPMSNLAPNPVLIEGVTLTKAEGIGDIAISPIILAWKKDNGIHIMSSYTAFLPTGRFTNGASNNIG